MIYFSQYIFVGYVPPVPRNPSEVECNESSSTARCQWTIGKQAVWTNTRTKKHVDDSFSFTLI